MAAIRGCATVAYLSLAWAVRPAEQWTCPQGVAEKVCAFTQGAAVGVATNCGLADEGVLEAAGAATSAAGVYEAVAVADTSELKRVFATGWARVDTGVAHEYLVEHLQDGGVDKYRIYQANSDGPLDIKEWLGSGVINWLPAYAKWLYGFKDTGRWPMHFVPLPAENPEHGWWAGVLKAAADGEQAKFEQAIVDKYAATQREYGGGQLLSFDKLQRFLQTPVHVGGGLGTLASTGATTLERVRHYS